jgi:hypothetical protein
MYGKRRIVLKGNGLVIICGGGNYAGIGRWHETDRGFAADLINKDQKFQLVRRGDLGNKQAVTRKNKKQLRDAIWDFAHAANIA